MADTRSGSIIRQIRIIRINPPETKTSFDPDIAHLFHCLSVEEKYRYILKCVADSRSDVLKHLHQQEKNDLAIPEMRDYLIGFSHPLKRAVQERKWEYVDFLLEWNLDLLRKFIHSANQDTSDITMQTIYRYTLLSLSDLPLEHVIEFHNRYKVELIDDAKLAYFHADEILIIAFCRKASINHVKWIVAQTKNILDPKKVWQFILFYNFRSSEYLQVLAIFYSHPRLREYFENHKEELFNFTLKSSPALNTAAALQFLLNKNACPKKVELNALAKHCLLDEYKTQLTHLREDKSEEELKKLTDLRHNPLKTAIMTNPYYAQNLAMIEFIIRNQPELLINRQLFYLFLTNVMQSYKSGHLKEHENSSLSLIAMLAHTLPPLRANEDFVQFNETVMEMVDYRFDIAERDKYKIFTTFITSPWKEAFIERYFIALWRSKATLNDIHNFLILVDKLGCRLHHFLKEFINRQEWSSECGDFFLQILQTFRSAPLKLQLTPDLLNELLLSWNKKRIRNTQLRESVAKELISLGANQVVVARMMVNVIDESKDKQTVHNASVHLSVSRTATNLHAAFFQGTQEAIHAEKQKNIHSFIKHLGKYLVELEEKRIAEEYSALSPESLKQKAIQQMIALFRETIRHKSFYQSQTKQNAHLWHETAFAALRWYFNIYPDIANFVDPKSQLTLTDAFACVLRALKDKSVYKTKHEQKQAHKGFAFVLANLLRDGNEIEEEKEIKDRNSCASGAFNQTIKYPNKHPLVKIVDVSVGTLRNHIVTFYVKKLRDAPAWEQRLFVKAAEKQEVYIPGFFFGKYRNEFYELQADNIKEGYITKEEIDLWLTNGPLPMSLLLENDYVQDIVKKFSAKETKDIKEKKDKDQPTLANAFTLHPPLSTAPARLQQPIQQERKRHTIL